MDFTWVSDGQNPRKNPNPTSIPSSIRLSNDPMNSSTPPVPRVSFTPNLTTGIMSSPSRRSRADTMPSQSSAFPYADPYHQHVNNTHHLTNFNMASNDPAITASRHRSGSITLPSNPVFESDTTTTSSSATSTSSLTTTTTTTPQAAGYFQHHKNSSYSSQSSHSSQSSQSGHSIKNTSFIHHNPYDPSSPMDENATNTIASTLASLGLDDDTSLLIDQGRSTSAARMRSFTVGTGNHLPAALAVSNTTGPGMPSFSPFSPQTRSNVLHRPRAISLGMADSFSPFDATSQSTHVLLPSRLRLQQSYQQPSLQNEVPLRSSQSSNNLPEMMMTTAVDPTLYTSTGYPMEQEYHYGPPDGADSPSSSQAQIPSRALWLGNINPSISVPDLVQFFSAYGQVESARILSDKECAFVNFMTLESAVAAKEDLETRLGSKLGGTPVRIGFGKADINLAMALTNEAGPNAQGPTRALWVGNIPANMNPTILRTIFQTYGPIESIRVLSHKNCGFINFEHQEDAVHARKALQNKEILGPGTGPVRIGFAKVVSNPSDEPEEVASTSQLKTLTKPSVSNHVNSSSSSTTIPSSSSSGSEAYQATQWATAMLMTNMMMNASGQQQTTQPSLYKAIASERQFIIQQLGHEPSERLKEDREPLVYQSVIPPVPELSADRKLEPLRLREMRKRLESEKSVSVDEVEEIAAECAEEIVELCSDYIGNTVVQKLFEHCLEETKLSMLKSIAPFLASIGVHKNGTWAAQKIIDHANTPEQIQLLCLHIAPYVPLLLLDQFGNYVVQCCLRKGPEHNQYIFDAIVDKCWEVGQGRFGARAVRSILENPIVTKEQQVYVAAAIIQNTILLTTNANGILLLNWLLDTSGFPGRYRVLCPRLLPYLNKLSSHKSGSLTVHRVVTQTEDPEASALVLNALPDKVKIDLMNLKK